MIEFSNVSKVYPNGVVGVDNVTLNIEQGDFVGIIGLFGSGKLTSLCLVNLMHYCSSGAFNLNQLHVWLLSGSQVMM